MGILDRIKKYACGNVGNFVVYSAVVFSAGLLFGVLIGGGGRRSREEFVYLPPGSR